MTAIRTRRGAHRPLAQKLGVDLIGTRRGFGYTVPERAAGMRRGSLRLRLLAAGPRPSSWPWLLAGFGLVLLFERHVERRMAAELGRTSPAHERT